MRRKCRQVSRYARELGCTMSFGLALSAACAGDLASGVAAYRSGDFDRAFPILRSGAEAGDANAQYLLGTLYRLGAGAPQDEYRAFHWYRVAAKEDMPEAQFQVGLMFLRGEGVTAREDEALEWLSRAADNGYARAAEVLEHVLYSDFTYGC